MEYGKGLYYCVAYCFSYSLNSGLCPKLWLTGTNSCGFIGNQTGASDWQEQVQRWRKVKLIKIGYIKDKKSQIGTLGTYPVRGQSCWMLICSFSNIREAIPLKNSTQEIFTIAGLLLSIWNSFLYVRNERHCMSFGGKQCLLLTVEAENSRRSFPSFLAGRLCHKVGKANEKYLL